MWKVPVKKHDNVNLELQDMMSLMTSGTRDVHLRVTMAVSEELSYIASSTFIISYKCTICKLDI